MVASAVLVMCSHTCHKAGLEAIQRKSAIHVAHPDSLFDIGSRAKAKPVKWPASHHQ